jgi:hypothetical protein
VVVVSFHIHTKLCINILVSNQKSKNSQNNLKMSFNGHQTCFNKNIFCTCDLHLKLDILNPLNIIYSSNNFLNELFSLQPFPLNKISRLWNFCIIWLCICLLFTILRSFGTKFFYRHQVHSMNMTFIEGGIILLYKKFEINCMTLCIPFDSFKKNVV